MHLVVLLRTLQRLVGPFGILQVLLRSYSPLQGCLVHDHFNKAPFQYCMPRTNDASVTWLGLNSFIVQTFYSLQLDQLASKKAVKMTLEMRSSYLPPSYHDIHKRLLNETKHKIKAQIAVRTKIFIRTYSATLAGDGWSSVNNHPLLNMMCVSPAGEEFLGAIDTSGHMKDAIYIADVIKRYLIEVGPKNVVQVCTDNASVMRKAVSIIQQ
jgi:hypothetical protein